MWILTLKHTQKHTEYTLANIHKHTQNLQQPKIVMDN